jgi:hypothetical protein
MGKHSQDSPGRRKGDPYPPAKVKCPSCGKDITNGAIPKAIHAGVCKGTKR